MKVLELYSGIGGMHMALKASGVEGTIETSIDINPVANSVYKHNFPDVKLLHRNIQGLSSKFINNLGVNTILMSPPCQPFTRNGLQGDMQDERTKSFVHILELLPSLKTIEKILIENVKGFESSQMRNLLIQTLNECGFVYQEFILSPTQLGVPNTRHRYYCIATKSPKKFLFSPTGSVITQFPGSIMPNIECYSIKDIIEQHVDLSPYYLEDKTLIKYLSILDICYLNSTNSCCFTKAYGRYMEGTGSVLTEKSPEFVKTVCEQAFKCDSNSDEYLRLVQQLQLRFFTPREVCSLMCFPATYTFPNDLKDRQKYMVLGNSINVKVVAELIKLLL